MKHAVENKSSRESRTVKPSPYNINVDMEGTDPVVDITKFKVSVLWR